jgi:hypothetical protein
MAGRKQMTEKQEAYLKRYQYKRTLEERRGHNYEYWTDKHYKMIESGWQLHYDFEGGEIEATPFEHKAQKIVNEYRDSGYYSRIICGYVKDVKRTKYYSVIYKKK